MRTTEYLAAVKASKGVSSDYALAKLLRVSTQAMSKYQAGADVPGPLIAFRIAEALQLPRDRVVADLELERSEKLGRADQAAGWRELLEKLGGIAAAVIVSVTALGGSHGANPASARVSGDQGGSSPSVDTRYTLCSKRRRKAARASSSIVADAAAAALAALSPRRHAAA